MRTRELLSVAIGILVAPTVAFGISDAAKCEAAKNKMAGKYAFCRLKAEAKAIKTGDPADYSKCNDNLDLKWQTAETNAGGTCPTNGDGLEIRDRIAADANIVVLKLSGLRYVDNGVGTVTDLETGLMWEQKVDCPPCGIHDKDDSYQWSATGTVPDGGTFVDFIGALNNNTSNSSNGGCFAGHCDWRLPTVAELETILDSSLGECGGGTGPCINPIFGPTAEDWYWSATTFSNTRAYILHFADGGSTFVLKTGDARVRAVRSAW